MQRLGETEELLNRINRKLLIVYEGQGRGRTRETLLTLTRVTHWCHHLIGNKKNNGFGVKSSETVFRPIAFEYLWRI